MGASANPPQDADGQPNTRTGRRPEDLSYRVPDSPAELTKPTFTYVLKRAATEFSRDQLSDRAAALTYFAVLSIFPALIGLVSILGLVGQGEATTNAIVNLMNQVLPQQAAEMLRGPISSITETQGAGLGLIIGALVALWAASKYVNAFSRAMNGIYGVSEGRPFWKLRPAMYALTVLLIVLVAIAVPILVVSGPLARAIGELVGLGETAVTVWSIAKWPVLLLIIVLVIAVLFYFTPNVKMSKFRWISPGAVLAIVVSAIAMAGFGLYVANFGSYNATYGAMAGVVIFLVLLWILNVVLLFGAEIDAELERGRELQGGLPAERYVQRPPRDDSKIKKDERKYAKLLSQAHAVRLSAGESGQDTRAGQGDGDR